MPWNYRTVAIDSWKICSAMSMRMF